MTRSRLIRLARILVGTGLIIAIFASIDLGEVFATLSSLDFKWLLGLCIVAVLLRALKSFKWWLLLRAREIAVTPWQSLRLHLEGNTLGTLTPAGFGSDVYRMAALSTLRKHKDVISTLMVERVIGYLFLVIVAIMSLPFSARYISAGTFNALLGVTGLGLVFGYVSFVLLRLDFIKDYVNKRLVPTFPFLAKVRSVFLTCLEFRHRGALLVALTMLTVLEVFLLVVVSYAAARSLQIDIPFLFLLTVVPLLHLLIRLPISFQALGIQEGLFIYMLILAGFTAADGLAISIVLRLVEAIVIFLPGAILLSTRSWMPKLAAVDPQETEDTR